ncbi:MobH family relaxase [Pseudomonas sp. MYb185]|uniref:MobH family relaxase n=1 Tax=Pseudomonas sp. MYb185 TaxID=1848729 RepID=UPI000CFD27A8|nr:MobH family relaxase [Pseudomonas sp. MYb185]PRB81558.1 relaxase [Pseudomonas sp. MYb185]
MAIAIMSVFKRLVSREEKQADDLESSDGWMSVQAGAQLLDTPYRQGLLQVLYELCSIPRDTFDIYVKAPVERYAELVQLLPASETHHHSYPGGMLDHGLEIMCYALRIRRKHLLPPGARPEDQVSVGELWSMGVLYAALLHDVAKALVDVEIQLQDGSQWRLWNGAIPSAYRVRYRPGRDYRLHEAAGALMCRDILGGAVMDWLYSDVTLFGLVMYTISGHMARAGIVGEIVHQADKSSVSKAMGGDLRRLDAAPKQSLQSKLVGGLRHLVRGGTLPLNGTKGSAVFLSEDAVWFVTPTVPRQLKTYLLEQGIPGVPADESRLYDEMLAHGLIMPNPEGLAVWSGCTVRVGEWSTAKLHLLKAAPSLIWGAEDERPEAKAVVTAISTVASDQSEETATPEAEGASAPITVEPGIRPVEAAAACFDSIEDEFEDCIPFSESQASAKAETNPAVASVEPVNPKPAAGPAVEGQADPGEEFVNWVKAGLQSKRLGVNHAKAYVHAVNGTWFLVSPNIFKKFCVERYGVDDAWEQVQGRFQKRRLHLRSGKNKQNIVSVSVRGPTGKTSKLKGFLLTQPEALGRPPADNIYLELNKEF